VQEIQFERLLSTKPFEVRNSLLCMRRPLDFWRGGSCPSGKKASFSSLLLQP
jgi:hypothetical protein